MRHQLSLLLVCLAVLAGACGDDDAGGLTTTPGGAVTTTGAGATTPTGTGGRGGCTVSVTGDVITSWDGPDDVSAFTSDYWYTNAELEQQFGIFSDTSGGSFDDVMAAGGQVFTFFLFNCQGPNGELVTLTVSADATRSDFPFGPGAYAVTSGMFGGSDLGRNDFSMLFSTNDSDIWGIDGAGTITLSEWDQSHVTGSFAFDAIEQYATGNARSVSVTGSFEVICQASVQC